MGPEDEDYVLLSDFKVDLRTTDGDAHEGNGLFVLCFWIYISECSTFPAVILEQKFLDVTSGVPFLFLDEKKMMTLFPLRCIHQEAPDPTSAQWEGVPFASSQCEFPVKKWVHIGCEILEDLLRLYIDGEVAGEKSLTFATKKDLIASYLKSLYLISSDGNEKTFHGYVHGLDISFTTSSVKDHYIKNPPIHLSIDYSNASDIEEDCDGVWSIVAGKASCRRIFSVDVILSDAFACLVNKDLEVVASLLYDDNDSPVDDTIDTEPPLLTSYDGIEYDSTDIPCKLIRGRVSFKLKISQLSSKSENRLFRIRFDIPKCGRYPFLETLSLPIRCVSRYRNTRTTNPAWRKPSDRIYYIIGSGFGEGSIEMIPSIFRKAEPSPSSKRIKLGQDKQLAVPNEDFALKQAFREIASHAMMINEDHAYVANAVDARRSNPNRSENFSSAFVSNQATSSDPNLSISSPFSYSNVFKYCLGNATERCQLLQAMAVLANEEHLLNFANEVSLYTGCSHHRDQILMSNKVLGGLHLWNLMSDNKQHVPWEPIAYKIKGLFFQMASCNRSLTDQDLECLRGIAGCEDLVSQENFERMWYWLYPVALNISKRAVNGIWDSMSPLWLEGFITKEEAEFSLHGEGGGLQEPGTFVLRFPTSRSWPHPDAGNLVVTYVGSDCAIHHKMLSLDFFHSCMDESKSLTAMLLEEPELSRLARHNTLSSIVFFSLKTIWKLC